MKTALVKGEKEDRLWGGRPLRSGTAAMHLLKPLWWSMKGRAAESGHRSLTFVKFVGFGGLIWTLLYIMASRFLHQFSLYPEIAEGLMTTMMGLTLGAAASLTLVASCIASLSVMFQSPDVRTMIVAPVDWLPRFFSHWIRAALMGGWAVGLVFTPVLVALGRHAQSGTLPYVAVVIIGGVCILLMCAALGLLLAIGLAAATGAGQAKTGVGLMAVLLGVVLYAVMSQGTIGSRLVSAGQGSALAMVSLLDGPELSWMPTKWWAKALVEAAWRGETNWAALAALCGALTLVTITVGLIYRVSFLPTLSRSRRESRRAAGNSKPGLFDRMLTRWATPADAAMVRKDLTRLVRASSDWSHWVLALGGYALFVVNLDTISLTTTAPTQRMLSHIIAIGTLGVGGLILASLTIHNVLPLVSLEGVALPLLRSAPVVQSRMIRVKFAVSLVLFTPLAIALSLGAAYKIDAPLVWYLLSVLQSVSLSLALVGLAMWLGVRYPLFSARGAGEVSGGAGATIFLLSAVGLISLSLLAIAPQGLYLIGTPGDATWEWANSVPSILRTVLLVMSFAVPSVAGIIALHRAEQIGFGQGRS